MSNPSILQSGSLAQHLYDYKALMDVELLLTHKPSKAVLSLWGLSESEYHQQLLLAIEQIKREH